MISYKSIVVIALSAVLAAGCAPSLKVPAPPNTSAQQVKKTKPETGLFGEVIPEKRPEESEFNAQEPTTPTGPTPESISKKVQFLLPSSSFINARIAAYNKKLDEWRGLQNNSTAINLNQQDTEKMVNCYQNIQKVLNGYTNMHDMIQQLNSSSPPIINAVDILELQRKDIDFMEGECNRLMTVALAKSAAQTAPPTNLSQMEALINYHWKNKEYEDVVQAWSKIPDSQIGNIDLKTKMIYGDALMYLHQEERAADVYQQIVNQMVASNEQKRDLLSQRKTLADLYTASENYPAAQQEYLAIMKQYKDLASIETWSKTHLDILAHEDKTNPELTKYSDILAKYMGFIPEQDGYKVVWEAEKFLQTYPDSKVAANVKMMEAEAQKRADAWFNGVFTEVDKLAAAKQYSEAMKKLQSIPDDIISPAQRLKIRDKNDALALSDAVQRETVKIAKMQELQHRWNNGLALIDAGKFDEAIKVFNSFQGTEYAAKAQDELKEISTIAAKAERRQAAELFIRFTKTSDPQLKEKLLVESRRLLKDILVKYPDINFADKVRDNIKRVESEMNTLDPKLLPAIRAAEQTTSQSDNSQNNTFQSGNSNAGTSSTSDVLSPTSSATSSGMPTSSGQVQEKDLPQQ